MSCLTSKSKLRLTAGRKRAPLLHIYFQSTCIVSFQIHFFFEARPDMIRTCITNKDTFCNANKECKRAISIKLLIFNLIKTHQYDTFSLGFWKDIKKSKSKACIQPLNQAKIKVTISCRTPHSFNSSYVRKNCVYSKYKSKLYIKAVKQSFLSVYTQTDTPPAFWAMLIYRI